jgi:hypothetical protein
MEAGLTDHLKRYVDWILVSEMGFTTPKGHTVFRWYPERPRTKHAKG